MIIVYFLLPIFLLQITLVLWIANPSIVFDHQGASDIHLGRERLISGSIFEENTLFDSVTNYVDWEPPYDTDCWDNISLNASLVNPMSFTKDCYMSSIPMDRPRKPSISDIIDVLNLQEGFGSSSKSNDGEEDDYVERTTNSYKSASILSRDEDSLRYHPLLYHKPVSLNYKEECTSTSLKTEFDVFKEAFSCASYKGYERRNLRLKSDDEIDGDKCFVALRSDDSNYSSENSSETSPANTVKNKERNFSVDAISNLFNTDDDAAVILVMDKNKNLSCLSTSRKKLEKYFAQTERKDKGSSSPVSEISSQKKRRGRKRVHEPDKAEDIRLKMRRERNNEASKIVRGKRKKRQSDLFKKESALIQNNLTLKTQLDMMTKQVNYMKAKLGLS